MRSSSHGCCPCAASELAGAAAPTPPRVGALPGGRHEPLHRRPATSRGGRSGYLISSSRVIKVLRNSDNENHYPISAPKKHYPQIRVPAKIGFGLPNLPEN
jgi:hypothetical protein